jgi:NADH:ubiquinone reductase (H+-translocating)
MVRTKVVVIGGGFGGLQAALKLRGARVDVTIIDKKNHHLFQPLLYQVAAAALSPADIATPLRGMFAHIENIRVLMGEVTNIDKDKKEVHTLNGDVYPFDHLILAPGARHSYFGNDKWEEHAPGLKTLRDALQIRERILISFEKAERLNDLKESEKYLNFVIIGGGPTGVEMAGAIAEIAHKTMCKNFHNIDPSKAKIYLVEAAPRILPPYFESLSRKAKKTLENMGVEVLTDTMVTDISHDGVTTKTGFIPSQNVVWAAGNQASPILKTLDTELDRSGRVVVNPDLSIPGHPNIFVIGDAACCMDGEHPIPAVAPAAIQQGRYVGKLIRKNKDPKKRRAFRYFDKGNLATIGSLKAVGSFGKIKFTGIIAWLAWGFIHILYLIGHRNRYAVMLDWYFHYLSGMRGARLVHHSIDEEKRPNCCSK